MTLSWLRTRLPLRRVRPRATDDNRFTQHPPAEIGPVNHVVTIKQTSGGEIQCPGDVAKLQGYVFNVYLMDDLRNLQVTASYRSSDVMWARLADGSVVRSDG